MPPLLFPLNRITPNDVAALAANVRPPKVIQPAFMQQRPQMYQGGLPPSQVQTRPWNTIVAPPLIDAPLLVPSVIHRLLPYPPTYFRITGTTRNSTGVALGNCTVDWFDTVTDVKLGTTTSDASGLFEFRSAGQPPNSYYLVAYLVGSPDVAGTTVNTLVGT